MMCRYKFDSLNMKQMRDFPIDKGSYHRDSHRKQIKLVKISEELLVNGSDIRSMETRRASIRRTYRTESSSTARGRRFATITSRICWTTSVF